MDHFRFKHPRTPHLPWSPGATADDVRVVDVSNFVGREVVVTEKMDGECTSMYWDTIHARSTSGGSHPSRDWVKGFHSAVRFGIPNTFRIVGENLFARHSVTYERLPSYFLGFAAFQCLTALEGVDGGHVCLSWDATLDFFESLGIVHVPVLYRGPWDEVAVRACMVGRSACGGEQEGYVVRVAGEFNFEDFGACVAKYVRAGHVQTDEHWMHGPVVTNGRE